MIIDNLTATDVFFERKIPITISCNQEKNNDGILREDNLGNKLISVIDSGDTFLGRLVKYSGTGGVIFYNEPTKKMRFVYEGESINLPIDFVKGTKYYVGARKIYGTYNGNYTFSADIGEDEIFKVFLDNGREINSYTIRDNTITLLGSDRLYIDVLSELIIYTYKYNNMDGYVSIGVERDEKNSNPMLNQMNTTYELEIEYLGYETIWDADRFMTEEYFETFAGEEAICFETLEVSQSIVKDSEKSNFSNSSKSIINSIDNSVNMDTFDGDEVFDIVQYMGADEFRILLVNPVFGRIVLINNCQINNGVSLIFAKEKNTKTFTVNCGNYIDIKLSDPSEYGMGKYGRGQYGDGTWIINSSRRGV